MKTKDAFGKLVDNGFDFLKKALAEFDSEPKFSVIHFYTALELLLKARLLHEHWTLILTKPEFGDLSKFHSGSFHSVTLDDAEKRLRDILQDGLSNDEISCFRDLRDHRNKVVHFFHTGSKATKSEIDAIVSQQCKGWYFLHGLLSERWADIFAEHQETIQECDDAMRKHRQYLHAKYSKLAPEIASEQEQGAVFHKCPLCGYHALEEDLSNAPTLRFRCRVCNISRNGVALDCPDCAKPLVLIGDPWAKCPHCGGAITDEEVKDALLDGVIVTKDDLAEQYEASCGGCGSHLSVAYTISGIWMCSHCFAQFDDSEIHQCEWCGEFTTKDVADSAWSGCGHCYGRAGWGDE